MTAPHSPFQTMFTGVPEEHLTIAAAEVESYARAVLDDIRTSSFMGTASEGSFTATASIAQLRAAAVAILHSPNPDPWAERVLHALGETRDTATEQLANRLLGMLDGLTDAAAGFPRTRALFDAVGDRLATPRA